MPVGRDAPRRRAGVCHDPALAVAVSRDSVHAADCIVESFLCHGNDSDHAVRHRFASADRGCLELRRQLESHSPECRAGRGASADGTRTGRGRLTQERPAGLAVAGR